MGKLIKVLIAIVLIVVVAVAGIIFTIDINQYKGQIVQLVKDNTGRDFEINGELKLAPSLIPTIGVEGVSLGNADWAKEKNILNVSKFEIQVSLIPLLKKNIQVVRLILIEPNINLETNKQGEGNWVFSQDEKKPEKASGEAAASQLPALAINEVQIRKANISYKDGKTGKVTKLLVDEVTVNSSSFSSPMKMTVKASINDSPLNVKATLGSINKLLENEDYSVELDANLANVMLKVNGKLGQPMNAKDLNLAVSLDMKSISDLNEVAGAELPSVGPIIFNGNISDSKNGYAIKGMTAKILEYDLSGNLEVSLAGPRPKLIANLSSEKLDISPFQGKEKETVKKEKLFSADPLPLEGLKAADADITFNTKSLISKSLIINNVKLGLKLNNGKLQLTQAGNAAGGSISTKIALDASNSKLAVVNNHIEIKQLELGQLPSIKEKELLTGGKTDISIKTQGSGASVAAIMSGLNGSLLVKAEKGKISSKALKFASADALLSTLSMLNPAAKKQEGSLLECAVVNFNIKDGIATADKGIAISTNQMNIIGSGTVDLKTETLDIGITPKAREGVGLNVGQLAGLVRIGGTLAAPSPKADAKEALKTGLGVGAAVATGGLSLLAEGLLNASSDDENPCDIALGIAPKKKAVSKNPETEKNPVEKTTDTVKDAAGAIGDKLKSLF